VVQFKKSARRSSAVFGSKTRELLREQERLLEKRMAAADMVLYDSRSQHINFLIRELSVEPEAGT